VSDWNKKRFPLFYPRSSICSFADHYYILCHLFLFFSLSLHRFIFIFPFPSRVLSREFEIISTLTFEMLLNKISWRDNGKSASFFRGYFSHTRKCFFSYLNRSPCSAFCFPCLLSPYRLFLIEDGTMWIFSKKKRICQNLII
jgi:hypothetical protein